MTTFTDTWNSGFEAIPADSENASQGANRIRDHKKAVRERLEVDHSWDGDEDDGEHKKVTFTAPLGSDPTNAEDKGHLYTKDVDDKAELFWQDEDGNAIQLTSGGMLNVTGSNVGDVKMKFSSTADDGWYVLNGETIGNASSGADHAGADLENLFVHLWDTLDNTLFPVSSGRGASGAADFAANKTGTLLDPAGRSPLAAGTGDATAEGDSTGTARAAGEFGGYETHTLETSEIPSHTHQLNQSSIQQGFETVAPVVRSTYSTGSWLTDSTGGGNSHNNMHPWFGVYFHIYGG